MSSELSNRIIRGDEKRVLKLKINFKAEAVTAIDKGNEVHLNDDDTSTIVELSSILTCPECFKSFRSKKALHGHMRCHDDREYRGMVPPAQKKSSRRIKTYSADDQVVVAGCSGSVGSDLTRLWFRGWPSDFKKRRTCVNGTGVAASCNPVKGDEDEEELMVGAAYGLLLLSTGDKRYRSLPSPSKGGIRVSEPSNKDRFDVNISSIGKKRKMKNCSQAIEMEMMMKSHQSMVSKKVLMGDGCGASLDPSHHVIGEESSAGAVQGVQQGDLSGQALGGHMRLQYKPPTVEEEADVGYCFDLNQIPDDDDC